MAPAGLGPGDGNAKGCQDRAGLAIQASLSGPPIEFSILSLSIQQAGCSAPTIPGPAGRSVTTCRRPVGCSTFSRPSPPVDVGEGVGERLRSACDETFAAPQPAPP